MVCRDCLHAWVLAGQTMEVKVRTVLLVLARHSQSVRQAVR